MTQHPPGYFAVMAVAARAFDVIDKTPHTALLILRLCSALLLAPLPFLTFRIGKSLGCNVVRRRGRVVLARGTSATHPPRRGGQQRRTDHHSRCGGHLARTRGRDETCRARVGDRLGRHDDGDAVDEGHRAADAPGRCGGLLAAGAALRRSSDERRRASCRPVHPARSSRGGWQTSSASVCCSPTGIRSRT